MGSKLANPKGEAATAWMPFSPPVFTTEWEGRKTLDGFRFPCPHAFFPRAWNVDGGTDGERAEGRVGPFHRCFEELKIWG